MSVDVDATERTEGEGFEPIVVDAGGLTVEKWPSLHDDDVFRVDFTITSDASVPLALRMVDHHPGGDRPNEVGFHPEYDPGNWRIGEESGVVYETVVAPGETRETVYGFRVQMTDELAWLLEPPTVETTPQEAAAPDEPGDAADRDAERSSGVEDVPAMAPETAGATQGKEGDGPIEDPPSLDADPASAERNGEAEDPVVSVDGGVGIDPDRLPEAGDLSNGSGHEHDGPTTESGNEDDEQPGRDGVIEALVAELERRDVDDDERAVLREGLGLSETKSVDARLRHVQETVDDLVAYRDALEGFIDERGPAEEIIDEFEATDERNRERIDALDADLGVLTERVDELGALEGRVESMDAELTDHAERLSVVDELSARIADLESEVQSLADRHDEDVDRLESEVQSLSDRHDEDVRRLDEEGSELRAAVEEETSSVEAELSVVRSEIEGWNAWREQVSDAMRAVTGGGEDEE